MQYREKRTLVIYIIMIYVSGLYKPIRNIILAKALLTERCLLHHTLVNLDGGSMNIDEKGGS